MTAPRYPVPTKWHEISQIKVRMQVDMLTAAARGAANAGQAAARIGMNRNLYVTTCRRLGIEIAHLLERDHPRWGEGIRDRVRQEARP
ncbi:hypothetical protein ACFSDD_11160 [Salipiger marinus]|uniref:hypothetical protein n=1 Tax=Salipiger marinus TaxID=555512 RepID=UPI002C31DC0A|nr:hypothetical protein [Salipiger manganoxidans]MEB3419930.1 hypothetical protein [Salipiger manganoxidans]